jgi:hypothetical protein
MGYRHTWHVLQQDSRWLDELYDLQITPKKLVPRVVTVTAASHAETLAGRAARN